MDNERWEDNAFVDFRSNMTKNEDNREVIKRHLRGSFEARLIGAVDRVWELQGLALPRDDQLYLHILLETRELFVLGYYYSCVTMCGVVGERLVKDVFRSSIKVSQDGELHSPSSKAFDQLERADMGSLSRFLKESKLLSNEAADAATDLIVLRNKYAHARGDTEKVDALKALTLLQSIVNDTVSIFKVFELKDGKLVPKKKKPPQEPDSNHTVN